MQHLWIKLQQIPTHVRGLTLKMQVKVLYKAMKQVSPKRHSLPKATKRTIVGT